MDLVPVGAFDLSQPIGSGGTGVVWKGRHRDTGVLVAVKILRGVDALRDRIVPNSFHNEVRAIAALDHPGIVWIYDVGEITAEAREASGGKLFEKAPYFVMEYASGGTLADFVPQSWDDVRPLLLSLLDALGHAHAHQVVHRDLKPGNVLRATLTDTRPGWKLTDFGIATALEQTVERSIAHELVGTLAYMSPEQIRGEWRDFGPWTDLYALGCLLYRVVGNQRPFGAMTGPALITAHIVQPPMKLAPRIAVPQDFDVWVAKLLEKRPEDRFQSAAEATRTLLELGSAVAPLDLMPQPLRAPRYEDEPTAELEGPTDVVRATFRRGPSRVPEDWRSGDLPVPAPRVVSTGLSLFGLRPIPMIGRTTERDLLWDRFRSVVALGRAEVIVIRGPGGVGKTRLARWLGERVHESSGVPFLVGEARHGEPPQEALARPFRRWFRTVRLTDPERNLRMRELLGPSKDDLAAAASAMLAPIGEAHGTSLGADARYAVARQLLEHVAAGPRGVVAVLDDVHLAPDLLRFAAHLLQAQRVRPTPVVLVLVLTEPYPGIEGELEELLLHDATTSIAVGPLRPAEHERLVQVMAPLEGTLAAQLALRTAGYPMHAVEVVRGWVAAGRLVPGEGGAVLSGVEAAVAPMPEVWRSRLKRLFGGLSPGARMILERAAALGSSVDEEEWQRVCDDPRGTFGAQGKVRFVPENAALRDELRRRMFAEHLATETDHGWTFVHELFRETLLTLAGSSGRLGSHHRACARMLLHRPDSRRYAERIGRHLLAGERPELAIPQLVEAFRERLRTLGDRAALPLLGELESALKLARSPDDDVRWAELSVRRAEVFGRMERMQDARRWAVDGERRGKLGGWRVLQARAARVVGLVRMHQGDIAEADTALARAEGLLREGEDARLLGEIHAARSQCSEWLGEPMRARGHARLAAQYLTDAGERRGLAQAWSVLGERALRDGALPDAERAFERARALNARVGSPVGEARALSALAEVARAKGDLEQARLCYSRSASRHRDAGSPGMIPATLGLARIELARRDWVEAHRLANQVLADADPGAPPGIEVETHAVLAAAAAGMRDWIGFDVHLERVASRVERHGIRDGEILLPGSQPGDIAWCLRLAEARLEAASDVPRASRAHRLAERVGAGPSPGTG